MKKRFGGKIIGILSVLFALTFAFAGCSGETVDPDSDGTGGTPPVDEKPYVVTYADDYTPTLFDKATAENEVTKLGDGAYLVANRLKLNDTDDVTDRNTVIYTIEVDLTKADIKAGMHNDDTTAVNGGSGWKKSAPYTQAKAWAGKTGGHVYASINADFFGEFGVVNAFVKDGVIVKAGHTDNFLYDYQNTKADVPASAPMLFGIKGETAQIAPIMRYEGDVTSAAVKQTLIQAKLTYDADNRVVSPDGLWNGYTTILGCRQALIIDGEIADTVAKENTNGAQRTDIPRSAVGIKPDGTVVVFAVEAMRYYDRSTSDSDPYGLSLPELAEFMRFYGIENGANFDGGGSTHLVVHGATEEKPHTVVRSADFTATSTRVEATRPVMNSLLVTTKV